MANTRDDFNKKTKNALALRAGYHCSRCKRPTAGPSDEGPDSVTVVGVAAHICAAAPGPGARRFDLTMTPEQRSHIENGIWLCATCGVLIDRDEKRFTVEVLREMRREHEAASHLDGPGTGEGDIVAFGPGIVAVGSLVSSGPTGMRVSLSHFVEGSARDLLAFAHDFDQRPSDLRYVLMNELGYGGLLEDAPKVERGGTGYDVEFRLQPKLPRTNATAAVADICAETFQMIYGMDAYIQNFERTLGMARGTWFARPDGGSDISDIYWRYQGSPWFARLAMMELIRLASLAGSNRTRRGPSTPFACVNRVDRVEVPTFNLHEQRLCIQVQFEVEGLGPWSGDLSVFISTPEQLVRDRATARERAEELKQIESESRAFRQ